MKLAFLFLTFFAPFAFGHDFPEPELLFDSGLRARTAWIAIPKTDDEASLRIEWRDANGAVEPGKFKVVLWMPDMGHGSAPTRLHQLLDKDGKNVVGAYDVKNMHFTMEGRWEIRIQRGTETKSFAIDL